MQEKDCFLQLGLEQGCLQYLLYQSPIIFLKLQTKEEVVLKATYEPCLDFDADIQDLQQKQKEMHINQTRLWRTIFNAAIVCDQYSAQFYLKNTHCEAKRGL